jgi:elongation factor Ts
MAVTMAEITKLRKISGAGMMDCKNALTEANGDIDKAMEIIRKKGQAVAAKRSDREASEGCVLAKKDGEFAAIIALKCETDFVAKNADFVALTQATCISASFTDSGTPASSIAIGFIAAICIATP